MKPDRTVPSCLRAFVPSCLRAFVPSCLRAFVAQIVRSAIRSSMTHRSTFPKIA